MQDIKKRACWNGCSFTYGEGFPVDLTGHVYDRIVSTRFSFDSVNQATKGASNYKIFMKSAEAIISNKYDFVFVQWSALNRLWLYPGPDCSFHVNDPNYKEFEYRNIHLDESTKNLVRDTILILNHDYQNIFDVVDYCSILETLAQDRVRVVFINGLVPWCNDLVTPVDKNNLGQSLSTYTKEILDFDHRDDQEIRLFFDQLQTKFSQLNLNLWVNVFESHLKKWKEMDAGTPWHHPGIPSNRWLADQVSNYLINNQLV
jgi:hypothetical protein